MKYLGIPISDGRLKPSTFEHIVGKMKKDWTHGKVNTCCNTPGSTNTPECY
jgi:hypothetical protein